MKNVARVCVLGGLTGVAIMAGPGIALADSPVYPPVAPPTPVVQVLGETVAQPAPAKPAPVVAVAPVVATATLPFTGLDTLALAGAGVVLVGAGAALTLVSRKRKTSTVAS
jgi:hypothetical protein